MKAESDVKAGYWQQELFLLVYATWVLMMHFGETFEEIRIPLFEEGYQQKLSQYSPNLKVPVLIDGNLTVWDSLAICEYVSEKVLQEKALPDSLFQRAQCRAYCAEMHSGFPLIRSQLPMNCRARRQVEIGPELAREIARIEQLWSEAREANAPIGPYLFGSFSMADAFYAPVAMRFMTYGIDLGSNAGEYMETLAGNRAIRAWVAGAREEEEVLPDFELGKKLDP